MKPEPVTGAIMTPIFATSTYAQPELGVSTGYEYARVSNPTRMALRREPRRLEGAAHGLCFALGMAAVSTMMGLFSQGDHLVVSENTYGGVYRVFELVFRNFGLAVSWVNRATCVRWRPPSGPIPGYSTSRRPRTP